MTPKEKAIDLLNMFGQAMYGDRQWLVIPNKSMQEEVKQCALIAVEELINTESLAYRMCEYTNLTTEHLQYWQEVKNEIEQL